MNAGYEEQPILSRPIHELSLSPLDPQYAERVRWYLVQQLHCCISDLPSGHLICFFPEGTVEETYAGQSTTWMRRTAIRLPSGVMLPTYRAAPLNNSQRSQTMLAFPCTLLEEEIMH